MARIPVPNVRKNRNFWLGVGGAIVIFLLLIASSVYKTAGIGQQTVEVEFKQAAGIRPGDKVKVSGIDVGTVSSTKLDNARVLTTLKVRKNIKFGRDAGAEIKMSTLLGSRFVDLRPGDGKGLPKNRVLLSNTVVPYDLADIIQIGTPKFEELNAGKLAESLNIINRQMGDSPALTAQALDSVGVLAKVMNDRRGEVDTLLKDLATVTKILGDNRNSILIILTQGEAITSRIMQRQNLIQQLLTTTATLSRQLQEIGGQNQGQFGPLIDTLNVMSQGLAKNKTNLDHLLEIMPIAARYNANAWGNGNYAELALPGGLFPDNWWCLASGLLNLIEGCRTP